MSTEAPYITVTGRHFKRNPGRERTLPREVRAHLYQLHLTAKESRQEIAKVLKEHGITGRDGKAYQMRRIVEERGA